MKRACLTLGALLVVAITLELSLASGRPACAESTESCPCNGYPLETAVYPGAGATAAACVTSWKNQAAAAADFDCVELTGTGACWKTYVTVEACAYGGDGLYHGSGKVSPYRCRACA